MQKRRLALWQAMQPLIGSVIGVGIFGLPFVFSQAGFGIAVIHLVVLGIANTMLLVMYADVVRNTPGHSRLPGIVGRYLGRTWSHISAFLMFASTWGAMVAYIIIGGAFLFTLLHPLFGGALVTYQLLFFAVSAFLVLGGLGFVTHLEAAFTLALLIMLGLIVGGSVPHIEIEHLTYINSEHWFMPFGVILFAFSGLAAIPEMAQMLGKNKKSLLRPAIIIGMSIVAVVYLLFATVIAGVTGLHTSEEAIAGLGSVVGDWAVVLGSVIGLFAVFTSFLILGLSIMDTLVYDYRRRYLTGWFGAVSVPFFVFLIGARDFIDVIGFTGSIVSGVVGLLVILMYIKAKKDVCLPKRCLAIPNSVVALCGVVFLFGIIVSLFGL